jgi:hypothetical protein
MIIYTHIYSMMKRIVMNEMIHLYAGITENGRYLVLQSDPPALTATEELATLAFQEE